MPKASEVAAELRKLADGLERGGDTWVEQPAVFFSYMYGGDDAKDHFVAIAPLLPRPLKKEYDRDQLQLVYETPALRVRAYIERSKVCTLVEPARDAVYRCEPLLSGEEEAELAGEVPSGD